MISNVQIVWKSLRNALNFRSILFLRNKYDDIAMKNWSG